MIEFWWLFIAFICGMITGIFLIGLISANGDDRK